MTDQNPPRVSGVSEQNTPSRKGGRPQYKPTDEHRALVRQLVSEDKPQAAIAAALEISPVTLRKHFTDELVKVATTAEGQLDFNGTPGVAIAQPGRPEFEPTYRQREDVKLFKADDWSDDRIATFLGISRNTLLKHFADELENGVTQVRARVLRNMMRESDAGSMSASDRLLKLRGMLAPAERLPTPEPSEPQEVKPPLGKKATALEHAKTAEQGTSWNSILKH